MKAETRNRFCCAELVRSLSDRSPSVEVSQEKNRVGSALMATAQTPRGRADSKGDPLNFRLVLVGKTGVGKSCSGNTILGRDAFRTASGHSSVTSECTKEKGEVCDRRVSVVDTPGLFDTTQEDDAVKREISKCINMSAPGPHAFLLVIRLGPFSKAERDAVIKVQEIFGEDAWNYTMILFTHGDALGKQEDLIKMLDRAPPPLKEILDKVGGRVHVFNNLRSNDRGQVLELLHKVDEMCGNGERCYFNPTYLEVKEMLDKRESALRKVYEEKLAQEVKAVESKYEKKLKEVKEKQEQEQMKKQREAELKETRRFYQSIEKKIRSVVEKMLKDDTVDETTKKLNEKLMLS